MSGGASLAALFATGHDAPAVAAIDPRLRLGAALLFALVMPVLTAPLPLALALLAGLAAITWARLAPAVVLRRLAVAEGFLLLLLLTLPFAVPGTPLFAILGLEASLEGISRAATLVVRINAALLVVLACIGGLGGQGLAQAMVGIGIPPTLAALLQMTMRYAATLGDEYRRLRVALRVRGFRARSDRHTWRSLGYLVGMLLVRSLERAERVRWAMLCRGYAGRFPVPAQRALGRADHAFIAIAGLALATLLGLELLP